MKRSLLVAIIAGTVLLAACSGSSNTEQTEQTSPATAGKAPAATSSKTTAAAQPAGCLHIPAAFFDDIGARGKMLKAAAIKSAVKSDPLGRDLYEVAARFSDGVAVWTVEQVPGGPTFHGLTFPQNTTARKHSDQGVDAPAAAIPDDPAGVSQAKSCVQA